MSSPPSPLSSPQEQFNVETMCIVMHNAYGSAALRLGWDTQLASRTPWAEVPYANKATMRAAMAVLIDYLTGEGLMPEDEIVGVCESMSVNGMTRCRLVAGHDSVHTSGAVVWSTADEL